MTRSWVAALAGAGAAVLSCVSSDSEQVCRSYCQDIAAECKGADAQYAARTGDANDFVTTCLSVCAAFPKTGGKVGDTLECRRAALTTASEAKADPKAHHQHCVESGPFSDLCGGTVANFCALEEALCPGNPFANRDACAGAFTTVPDGPTTMGINDPEVATANTKLCRGYHLEKSTEDATTHCPHTSAPNSPVCTK